MNKKKVITISIIVAIVIAIAVVLYFIFKDDKKDAKNVSELPGSVETKLPTTASTSSEKTYTVQPGDTLSGIAVKFDTTVDALVKKNNISNPDLIIEGQLLYI
jgi:LysM repeat protein